MALLDPTLVHDLRQVQEKLTTEGRLLPKVQLDGFCATFRQRFGPEQLKVLDGEALLETIHNHSNRDSLVYWLEFKNDDELPAAFGSIAGGSALKFGVYRRKETGAWMTGSPQNQRELSLDEAIQMARTHRDQLIKGAELLEQLPKNATDAEYATLQLNMDRLAPDVSNLVWGHKYFSLLYPDKLDDYHNPDYQRFHLIKLLQLPPEGSGRYTVAGRYVALANELDLPLNHLTTMLNHRDGSPYRYWRIGTSEGTQPRNRWELMRDGNCVAIGWPDLGSLAGLAYDREDKEEVRAKMGVSYPGTPQTVGRAAQQVFNFVAAIASDDLALASDGSTVLGIGKVSGEYSFDPSSDFPHRRPVQWLDLEEWKLPEPEGLQTTVHEIKKDVRNLIEIERRILGSSPIVPVMPAATVAPAPGRPLLQLAGVAGRIQSVLERKGQVILYGPPGTGKTYWALKTACDLASYSRFGVAFEQLAQDQKAIVMGHDSEGLVRVCSFHPAYGYEDFLEGYKPISSNTQLSFEKRDGIFKRLCEDARQRPDRFYLIIDEINRGDIPRIFGELLTILEKDKRGKPILLPLSGSPFSVPDNVYVIGTMNTADRSIALLDTALRRRFGFVELMPDSKVLGKAVVGGIPLAPWLDALNRRICEHIGRDARNLQIGHAYLLEGEHPVSDMGRFARIIHDDIVPLLEEYCYEDYTALSKILGKGLVDESEQRIRHELFDAGRQDELIAALLAPCPEIVTLPQAVTSEAIAPEETLEDNDGEAQENNPAP